MNFNQPDTTDSVLSPKRIEEKANVLENNLHKYISKQAVPSRMQITIDRERFPDAVITKALLQLLPQYNILPRVYLLALKDLLQKKIPPDKSLEFKKNLDLDQTEESDDPNCLNRVFHAIASEKQLTIIVLGVPETPSIDGEIAKSYFDHKLSAGKLLKNGVIDFKEINKYPVVNADDNLFYIANEFQGKPGLSFDGKVIPVKEALPYPIQIGDGVVKIEDIGSSGESKGYYLMSQKTGVVLLLRNETEEITGIAILEQVEIQKLDYSVGNIGTQYTCPVSMKVGQICSGFKLRVNGRVEADIVDGGQIITNNEAVIIKAQSGSSILALKDITVNSASHAKLISERGTITIENELIDSNLSAPKIVFEKSKGLTTNNRIETENLRLAGCYFSAENIIFFGNSLFVDEKELIKTREQARADRMAIENNEKLLMGQLQLELKRLAKLTVTYPDLIQHIKPLIIATQTMDFPVIFQEIEKIAKRNNPQVVANVKKIFETLEKNPEVIQTHKDKETRLKQDIQEIRQRMAQMTLTIEGVLRRAATIKIFCGHHDSEKKIEPDYILESEGIENKYITLKGSYSPQTGFEFVH
ncbi:MAG: flagellar assembly protein A [Pseudomonadota bacterium]